MYSVFSSILSLIYCVLVLCFRS